MLDNKPKKVDSWDEEVTNVTPKKVDSWDEEVVTSPKSNASSNTGGESGARITPSTSTLPSAGSESESWTKTINPLDSKFQNFKKTLPSNLKNTDESTYNLRGYWEGLGKPDKFDYSQKKEADGTYHASSRNQKTGEILKKPNHPTFIQGLEEDAKMGYMPYISPNGTVYTFSKEDKIPSGFKPYKPTAKPIDAVQTNKIVEPKKTGEYKPLVQENIQKIEGMTMGVKFPEYSKPSTKQTFDFKQASQEAVSEEQKAEKEQTLKRKEQRRIDNLPSEIESLRKERADLLLDRSPEAKRKLAANQAVTEKMQSDLDNISKSKYESLQNLNQKAIKNVELEINEYLENNPKLRDEIKVKGLTDSETYALVQQSVAKKIAPLEADLQTFQQEGTVENARKKVEISGNLQSKQKKIEGLAEQLKSYQDEYLKKAGFSDLNNQLNSSMQTLKKYEPSLNKAKAEAIGYEKELTQIKSKLDAYQSKIEGNSFNGTQQELNDLKALEKDYNETINDLNNVYKNESLNGYEEAVNNYNSLAAKRSSIVKGLQNNEYNTIKTQYDAQIAEYDLALNDYKKFEEPEIKDRINKYFSTVQQIGDYDQKVKTTRGELASIDELEKAKKIFSNAGGGTDVLDIGGRAVNSILGAAKKLVASPFRIAGSLSDVYGSGGDVYHYSDFVADLIEGKGSEPLFLTKEKNVFYDSVTDKINWGAVPVLASMADQAGVLLVLALTGKYATPTVASAMTTAGTDLTAAAEIAESAKIATTIAPAFMISYGDNYKEALDKGFSAGGAMAYSGALSFLEGLTETILPDQDLLFGKGAKDAMLNRFIKDYAKGKNFAIKNMTNDFLFNAFGEATEEAIAALGKTSATSIGHLVDNDISVEIPTMNQNITTSITAGLTGGGMGIVGSVSENSQMYKMGVMQLANDFETGKALLSKLNEKGKIDDKRYNKLISDVQKFQSVRGQIPEGLSGFKTMAVFEKMIAIKELSAQMDKDKTNPFNKINAKKISAIQDEIEKIVDDKNFDARAEYELNLEAEELGKPQEQKPLEEKPQEQKPVELKKNTSPTPFNYGTINRNDGKGVVNLTQEEYLKEESNLGLDLVGSMASIAEGADAVESQPTKPKILSVSEISQIVKDKAEKAASSQERLEKMKQLAAEARARGEQIRFQKEEEAKLFMEQQAKKRDEEVAELNKIRPDLSDQDLLMADISPKIDIVLDRVDANVPTDPIQIEEAISELDKKFAELEAYKKDPKRTHTTEQIDEVIDILSEAKSDLQFYQIENQTNENESNAKKQSEGKDSQEVAGTKETEIVQTPKTKTNEKANEDGEQKRGKDGEEDVPKSVQSEGEDGGNEVNLQEKQVLAPEGVVTAAPNVEAGSAVGGDVESKASERIVYDREPTADDGVYKILGDERNVIYRVNPSNGRIQEYSDGFWSNTPSNAIARGTARKQGFQKIKDPSKSEQSLQEAPKTEQQTKQESTELRTEEKEAVEGSTVKLPPSMKGGMERTMVFKDGEWQQSIGGSPTKVGEKVKAEADEAFKASKKDGTTVEAGSVEEQNEKTVDNAIKNIKENGRPLSEFKVGDKVVWASDYNKSYKQYTEGVIVKVGEEYQIQRFSENPISKKYKEANFDKNTLVVPKLEGEAKYTGEETIYKDNKQEKTPVKEAPKTESTTTEDAKFDKSASDFNVGDIIRDANGTNFKVLNIGKQFTELQNLNDLAMPDRIDKYANVYKGFKKLNKSEAEARETAKEEEVTAIQEEVIQEEEEQYEPITVSDTSHDTFTKDNAVDYEEDEREGDNGRSYTYLSSVTVELIDDNSGDTIGTISKLKSEDGEVTYSAEDADGNLVAEEVSSKAEAQQAVVNKWNKQKLKEFNKEKAAEKKAKAKEAEKAKKKAEKEAAKTKPAPKKTKSEQIAEGLLNVLGIGTEGGTKSNGVNVNNKSALSELEGKTTGNKRAIIEAAKKAIATLKSVFPYMDIYIHEDIDSYNEVMGKVGGFQNSAGNFAYESDANGNPTGRGRIDINLSNANARTVAHEVSHAVMLKAFGDNPALFKSFRDKISKVLNESSNKALMDFANQYVDEQGNLLDVTYEEYLAELTAALAAQEGKLSPTTLQKIAALINDIVSKLTNGKLRPFEDIKDTKQVVEFFSNISSAIREGNEIKNVSNKINKQVGKNSLKSRSQIVNKANAVKDIDVKSIRMLSRAGNRVSKGLSVKTVNNKKVVSEAEDLTIDYVKENAPNIYIANANIISEYPIVKGIKKIENVKTIEEAQEVYDIFVRQVADNLKYLIDNFNDEFREISTLWYDGANILAQNFSEKYNVSEEQAAGIIAAMSPQKDWYQNVRLAEMVMMAFNENPIMTNDMIKKQILINIEGLKPSTKKVSDAKKAYTLSRTKANKEKLESAKKNLEEKTKKGNKVVEYLKGYIGKNMNSVPNEFKCYYARLWNEVNTTKDYDVLRPDSKVMGTAMNKDGITKSKVAWGSYTEIGKAVAIYIDGSQENITKTLGEMHKIRNFFNNIIDPMSNDKDVTMDTHAVAAALLLPLSGNSKQVGANFGTGTSNSAPLGIKGLYYAFADGYNLAAEETGLLPRQVQSITWEAVRGLFTDDFKRDNKKVADINQIVENYVNKKITLDESRNQITEYAGGINDPSWAEPLQEGIGNDVKTESIGGRGDGNGRSVVGKSAADRGKIKSKSQKPQNSQIKDYIESQRAAGESDADIRAGIESVADRIGLTEQDINDLMSTTAKTEDAAATQPIEEKPNFKLEGEGREKERSFTNKQFLADKSIPDNVKAAVTEDAIFYNELPNSVSVEVANKIYDLLGSQEALDAILDEGNGMSPVVRIVLGQVIIRRAKLQGGSKAEADIMLKAEALLAKKGTEYGQAIQAFSLFQFLSKEGQIMYAVKQRQQEIDAKLKKDKNSVDARKKALNKINEKTINEVLDGNVGDVVDETTKIKPTSQSKNYGEKNKIVTKKRYEEIKRALKGKFFSNIPPELVELGVYHIEAGSRKFAEFSKAMIGDVGTGVKKYLRDLYDRAKNDYESNGGDVSGFSNEDEITDAENQDQAEKLAKFIVNRAKQKKQSNDPVKQMVSSLLAKVGEKLPKRELDKMTDIEKIALAIKNREQYADVWEKSKTEVESLIEKLNVSEEDKDRMRRELQSYYDEIIGQPFAETTLNKAVREGLNQLSIDVKDVIRKHYTVADNAKKTLVEKLVMEANLSDADARYLASKVEREFNRIATERKKEALDKLKKPKDKLPTKKRQVNQLEDEIIALSNLGAFSDEDFLKIYAEKMGWKQIDEADIRTIGRLAEIVEREQDGFRRARAVEDLLAFQARLKGTSLSDVGLSIWYANVLSGPTTQLVNIIANTTNLALNYGINVGKDPIGITKSLVEGFKRGMLEGFSTLKTGYSPIRGKVETPNTLELVDFKGIMKPANIAKYVRRIMAAADVLTFEPAKEMRAYQMARKIAREEGATDPTLKQRQRAMEIMGNTREKIDAAKIQAQEEYNKRVKAINDNTELTAAEKKKEIATERRDVKRRVFELIEQQRAKTSADIIPKSEDYARRLTYNYKPEGVMGFIASKVNDATRFKPLKFIVPFTNIIANVANESLNYTPLGFVRAATKKGSIGNAISPNVIKGNQGFDVDDSKNADAKNEMIIKAALGTLFTVAIYAMAGDSDDDEIEITADGFGNYKDNYTLTNTGWQPYSIRVGKTWISYQYTPFMPMFSYIGKLKDSEKYRKEKFSDSYMTKVASAAGSMAKTFFDNTFLSSMNTFFNAIFNENTENTAEDAVKGLMKTANSFVLPNFYTQVAKEIEMKMNIPVKDMDDRYYAQILKDVPFARNIFQNKVNALGEDIVPDTDKFTSDVKIIDPKVASVNDLWDMLVKNKYPLRTMSYNQFNNDGIYDPNEDKQRVITPEEYYGFMKVKGGTIKEFMFNNYEDLQELTPKEFSFIMGKVKEKSTEIAKLSIFTDYYEDDINKIVKDLEKINIPKEVEKKNKEEEKEE